MAVYVVTGKLGGGKSIMSVARIQERLNKGCKVATNLDLNLVALLGRKSKKCRVLRVPDKPCLDDLLAIGKGNLTLGKPIFDESKNGLLVLDECGTWFNSRSWNDKGRQEIINWLLHARKLGWDIIFIVQHLSIIDKQARLTLAEHVVFCKRTDRIMIPIIGTLIKAFTGNAVRLPKVHMGIVKYGDEQNALTVDRWSCWGAGLYSAYDTRQVFSHNYDHGVFSYLPPYYTNYRYRVPMTVRNIMRITKIYFKTISRPLAFLAGITLSYFIFDSGNDGIISQAVASVESVDVSPYKDYKIVSYSKMPNSTPFYTLKLDDKTITSEALTKLGLTLTNVSRCQLKIANQKQESLSLTCGR